MSEKESKCQEPRHRAVAVIRGDTVQGAVWFTQSHEGPPTTIEGEIKGLSPGLHGFHIHQYGDMTNGCTSAGPHFNPFNKSHGDIEDAERHVGDLGNVEADSDGVARFELVNPEIMLCGPISVVGRSLVIHKDIDDLGRGEGNKQEESKKTGNAGERLGCGVIALAEAK